MRSDFWTTPWPPHSRGTASPGASPVPPQAGQALANFMKPRWTVARPLPPQVGQGRSARRRPWPLPADRTGRRGQPAHPDPRLRRRGWRPRTRSSSRSGDPRRAPAPGGGRPRGCPRRRRVLEEIPERRRPVVGEIEAFEARAAGPCRRGPAPAGWSPTNPNWSYWRPFLRVAEDGVGLLDLLELGFRRLVPGIEVGVVLAGQLPVGLLDLGRRGPPWRRRGSGNSLSPYSHLGPSSSPSRVPSVSVGRRSGLALFLVVDNLGVDDFFLGRPVAGRRRRTRPGRRPAWSPAPSPAGCWLRPACWYSVSVSLCEAWTGASTAFLIRSGLSLSMAFLVFSISRWTRLGLVFGDLVLVLPEELLKTVDELVGLVSGVDRSPAASCPRRRGPRRP